MMRETGMSGAGMMSPDGMAWPALAGVILLGLVVATVVWVTRSRAGPIPRSSPPRPPTPLEALDRRYDRGELDWEEYLTRRVHLIDRTPNEPLSRATRTGCGQGSAGPRKAASVPGGAAGP